jgi:hypothetical protein
VETGFNNDARKPIPLTSNHQTTSGDTDLISPSYKLDACKLQEYMLWVYGSAHLVSLNPVEIWAQVPLCTLLGHTDDELNFM